MAKSVTIPLLFMLLTACGGASPPAGTPPAGTPSLTDITQKQATYLTNPSGCLTNHNADTETHFLFGDKLAHYLTWHCAKHNEHEFRQVRILFAYDYAQSCYTERLTVLDFAHCSGTIPAPPAVPAIAVNVASFKALPSRNNQGLPGFDCTAVITNSGNVPAFAVGYRLRMNNGSPVTEGTINIIEPKGSVTIDQCDAYGTTLIGQQYELELDLRDVFNQPLLARMPTTTVSIP